MYAHLPNRCRRRGRVRSAGSPDNRGRVSQTNRRFAAPILVVDDNLDAREMYCLYLQHDGFRCIEAADGATALQAAAGQHPDLILMDGTMPGIDGWESSP